MLTPTNIIEHLFIKLGVTSVNRVAIELKLSQPMVRSWYRGISFPTEENLLLLAKAADVDTTEAMFSLRALISQGKSEETYLFWHKALLNYKSQKKRLTAA